MNYYGPGMGIPVITFGPGDAHLDHTRYEKLSFEDLFASIEIIKEAIKNLKKFSDKNMYE
jgi:LysW-gamma-L-lysine carboxypeptidase